MHTDCLYISVNTRISSCLSDFDTIYNETEDVYSEQNLFRGPVLLSRSVPSKRAQFRNEISKFAEAICKHLER